MEGFLKYPKIRRINDLAIGEQSPGYGDLEGMLDDPRDLIYIQEKIDGSNLRVMIKDGQIVIGSRKVVMDQDMEQSKHWDRAVSYIREKITEDKRFDYNVILFGEAMIKHCTPYDFYKYPPVIFYDVWGLDINDWYDPENAKKIIKDLGLEWVNEIEEKPAHNIKLPLKDSDVPKSKYYYGQAEGIVLKNYRTGQFAKHVTEEHREENRKIFGGKIQIEVDVNNLFDKILFLSNYYQYQRLQEGLDPEDKILEEEIKVLRNALRSFKDEHIHREKFVLRYCTNQRIDKCVFKLLDEGHKLGISLMKYLPKRVIDDIFEENWKEIFHSGMILDLRNVRKKIGHRCKAVLKQIINNAMY